MGSNIEVGQDYVVINSKDDYKPTIINTAVYPGFPTDLQQPFTVLLTQANGQSKVTETIWENRFMHVPYLNNLGADITIKGQTATIRGKTKLKGGEFVATDLRAGAAMVIAGLIAKGTTKVNEIEHILRGYENIVEKLTGVGADISIKED
jgi:UDP-N-acetylglucosamine 1-carboxyvinyltransferase